MMKAVYVGPQGLVDKELPIPQPGPGQVLVKVSAAGLNRADILTVEALAGSDLPEQPMGMEWAGEVTAVGTGVEQFRVGERVMCTGAGGYAEYAVADAGRVMPLADTVLDDLQAGGMPLVLMTAHNALVTNGALKKGDTVLVQGATSGVGLMCLRMARLMGAARVIGTTRRQDRLAALQEHGADHAVSTDTADWDQQVREWVGDDGVNVAIDMVSGPPLGALMTTMAVGGRIVNVGRLGGAAVSFDADLHALKQISYIGVTFRTRTLDEIRRIVTDVNSDLGTSIAAGQLSLPVERVFPLQEARLAHDYMASNDHLGKIILKP